MGNTQSKPPGQPAQGSSAQWNEKKVNRRTSIQALSGSKSAAVDPAASKESATGQYTQRQQTPVHQRLQSRNIADSAGRGYDRPERRTSKKEREDDVRDLPSHSKPSDTPEPARAVQVPTPASTQQYPYVGGYGPSVNTYYAAPSHLSRPPRLPLPIGDAMSVPGSPITASGSLGAAAPFDRAEIYPPKAGLGDTADDDDEVVDELESFASGGLNKAVSTFIEWKGGGEKVYVTGSFVNWARKFKLHKSDDDNGVFLITLKLRPGTHHLKFIVDGVMRTSDNLPTAVDFTNHLVNYIEISPDEMPPSRGSDKPPKVVIPPGLYPPQVLPESLPIEEPDKEAEEEIVTGDFLTIIPPVLIDIDTEESTPSYTQAANIINDFPTPPMLPMFLGRSILNSSTPMKDDNSVLNYPNHTVLNHLATSSIKNKVLATSVTTRYKRKMYQPVYESTEALPLSHPSISAWQEQFERKKE
ncbi:galactose metabolism- protein [Emydomyces testavorans]|uniref:Galactose metabolism- protein n=1 Tax=Emydomyces testavorans TaxID=2070801 RepID=A0AAF0DRF6_9EURO|nr:galactose metabolism- protein [Emydomyces testavorans]